MYIMVKDDNQTRLDLMFPKKYIAQVASLMTRYDCSYRKAQEKTLANGETVVCFKDIRKGPNGNGRTIGELLHVFYSLEWDNMVGNADPSAAEDKFYIMFSPARKKRRMKKNVYKNRKEANEGSNSGIGGEPAGSAGSGEMVGTAGNGDTARTGSDGASDIPAGT